MDTPCVLWKGSTAGAGYGKIKRDGRWWIAPRWFWTQANGPIPEGMQVLHRCDVRLCVNVDHLFLGTQRDNMADMDAKGRRALGIRHGRAKLTDEQVAAIRDAPQERGVQSRLARRYGVTQGYVSTIRSGRARV